MGRRPCPGEKAALAKRMAQRAQQREDPEGATRHARLPRAAERRAGIVREVLVAHQATPDHEDD